VAPATAVSSAWGAWETLEGHAKGSGKGSAKGQRDAAPAPALRDLELEEVPLSEEDVDFEAETALFQQLKGHQVSTQPDKPPAEAGEDLQHQMERRVLSPEKRKHEESKVGLWALFQRFER